MDNHTYAGVRAVYHEGVLTLLDPLALPDGAQVEVDVHFAGIAPAEGSEATYPTRFVSVEDLQPLIGIISVGGDALADSEAM